MTHHLTPYRRRPAPDHPGFDPREIDVDMDICRWCGGLVPAAETQRVKHEDWEQRIANRLTQLLDRVAILEAATAPLSGSAQAHPGRPADPDPTSRERAASHYMVPPDRRASTPEPEASPEEADRSGVEAANHERTSKPGVVEPPPDATSPPGGPLSPRRPSGGTNQRPAR